MLKIALHAYSSMEQTDLQARLIQLVVDCRGWVLEEKMSSLRTYHLRFEVNLSHIAELYGALQQVGLQFTPVAHRSLTEMCLCRKHLSESEEIQIVSIDLQIGTIDEDQPGLQQFIRPNPV